MPDAQKMHSMRAVNVNLVQYAKYMDQVMNGMCMHLKI